VHGAELRIEPGSAPTRRRSEIPDRLRARIVRLGAYPGVLIEDKGVAIAIHYRMAPPDVFEHLRTGARRALEEEDPVRFSLLEGKRVLEIKPADLNKGTGLAELMGCAPFRGRRPVFAGDDITDQYAFARLSEWNGLGIAVGPVRPGAQLQLTDTAAVRQWVHELAQRPDEVS
jgi:trehalose 6-phosphate phosphatase